MHIYLHDACVLPILGDLPHLLGFFLLRLVGNPGLTRLGSVNEHVDDQARGQLRRKGTYRLPV